MQDNLGLIIIGGICTFGLLFMVAGVVLYNSVFGVFRRFFIVGIINKVIGDVKDDVEDEGDKQAPHPVQHIRRSDIRAKAESLDFDAALAKYGRQTGEFEAEGAERPDSDDDDDRPPVIRRHREFHHDDDDED